MSDRQQCQCPTQKGAQCKRTAPDGSDYCWQHEIGDDVSPAKKTSAERAREFARRAGRKIASAGKAVGREAGKAAVAAGKVGYGVAKEFGKEALGAVGEAGKEAAQEYGRKAGQAAVRGAIKKIGK